MKQMKKDKMRNTYFVIFHKTMKKYINNAGAVDVTERDRERGKKRFSQCELYNELFSMQLKETSREDEGISEAQISRWLSGKENVPNWILSYVFHDSEGCRRHYRDIFEKYIDEINIFRSAEAEKKLAEEMWNLKIGWGIELFSMAQDDNLWDILAGMLATALTCDYALNIVELETGLQQYLLEKVKFCREKNVAFKTPFILSVFFQNDHSLLRYTLNKLEKGLGEKWSCHIHKYINAEHSQTFEEVYLDKNDLLNYARIHSCLNNKTETDELELCCAIVSYPGSSNTLKQLKNILCKYGYNDYGSWRKLLLQNEKDLKGTSVNYFIND